MQSTNQSSGAKKMGHVRRQSYGKIMPISSLLNNIIGSSASFEPTAANDASNTDHSPLAQSFEVLAHNRRFNERSDGDSMNNVANLTMNFINFEKIDDMKNASKTKEEKEVTLAAEIDFDKTFLKCVNYHPHDAEPEKANESTTIDANADSEDNIDRLLGSSNNDDTPCLLCSNQDEMKNHYLNILCKKLCDESCNTSTKTCRSLDDGHTPKSGLSSASTFAEDDVAEDGKMIQQKIAEDDMPKLENPLQRSNSSRQEFLASMLDSNATEDNDFPNTPNNSDDEAHVAPLTMENLKQFNERYFREKLAIAEALANTSMMTSPAVKRRLQARKMELSLNAPDFVYDPENAEYIPPKELLMYLVR